MLCEMAAKNRRITTHVRIAQKSNTMTCLTMYSYLGDGEVQTDIHNDCQEEEIESPDH